VVTFAARALAIQKYGRTFYGRRTFYPYILKQPQNEFIRDGVIQRFEFTFELSWKLIKRYFK